MKGDFVPDDKVREHAEGCALDAIELARARFKTPLDRSEKSIGDVEKILAAIHRDKASVNEEEIYNLGKIFGSYIGEVYRKNRGATWGMVSIAGQTFPGMQAHEKGNLFWPWGQVINRIKKGPQDNVTTYYDTLVRNPAQ